MKRINKALATFFSLSLLLLFVPSRGMGYAMHARPDDNPPAAPADTDSLSEPKQYGLIQAGIHLLARSYGDSIVLRWGAEDYVTQRTLDDVGVMVVRYDYSPEASDPFCDTLVTNLRPWTLEQFEAAYAKEDSMARMAMGIMYSKSGLRPDQTKAAPGTLGSFYDIYQDQQTNQAFRMLVAEWRRDLAQNMAMRWVDTNVRPGHEYEYIVRPVEYDTTMQLIIAPAVLSVKNERYLRPEYDIEMGDSIVSHCQVRLWWEDRGISSYEIDRRRKGETEWTRVNDLPYWNMQPITDGQELPDSLDCFYGDLVPEPGDYEYRIMGHDPFGDLTKPSPVHSVHVPDMDAPRAPELVLVEIDRQDSTDLSKQVMATFHFEKDTIEADFTGFNLLYYNERHTGKEWKTLNKELIPPTDTTYTCDVTGYSTGMVLVAAYDTAQNVSYSIPRMVQIKDVKAPSPMRNFKAEASIEDGTITLTWEPDTLDDDIEYYEVLFANDTTHSFVVLNEGKLKEPRYVDTVAMDVNQKYIYYKVRAIDYSTNQSDDVMLQVLRPTRLKPQVAHLLESSADSAGIHMKWACSNEQIMDRHVLMRRLRGEEKWDTLGIFSADSIRAADNVLEYHDRPAYNRKQDYQYCVESFSCFDISSGLSLLFTITYQGPRIQQIPVRLEGAYLSESHETRLTWEINEGQAVEGDWYICIYRKGPRDDSFQFHISVPADTKERRSSMLAPGQSEEYYIKLRFEDGRESMMSNKVSVSRPKSANGE